jgi:uncharacterized membrane protein YhaH (DUF805 family)
MNHLSDILTMLLDPRGRMGRTQLLAAASVMLAVEVGLLAVAQPDGALPPQFWPVKMLGVWIAGVAVVKRLHDVGLSGWWLLGGLAGLCMWAAVLGIGAAFTGGIASLQPGGPGYLMLLAALMVPALGATLWMHLASGEAGMNRFGAPPAAVFGPADDHAGAASGR